jgi:ApaG protein
MTEKSSYTIDVQVETRFVPDQSKPGDNRYVFAYTITLITDANGKVEEVRGDGVVGEQPWMRPGENFEYTSGAVLETPVGIMGGSYQMLADDGTEFEATIPTFTLSIPRTLH